MRSKYVSGLILVAASGLCACGSDGKRKPPLDASTEDAGMEHADHEEENVTPCPERIPDFEVGMVVIGENKQIRARLVSASPVTPRRYENSWTFEFLDADDQPITDIEVEPDEPWMDAPGHNHGAGYAPDVVRGDASSQLEFDAINLKMAGPWRLNLNASSSSGDLQDVIIMEACVP